MSNVSSAAAKTGPRRLLDRRVLERARLVVVPRRRTRAPRIPFVALVSVILLGGVVGLLMFNTSMQNASFTEQRLSDQASALAAQQQVLEMDLQHLRDPQTVAEAAQKEGLVIPTSVAMINVVTGRITGQAAPATGDNTPPLFPVIAKPTFRR